MHTRANNFDVCVCVMILLQDILQKPSLSFCQGTNLLDSMGITITNQLLNYHPIIFGTGYFFFYFSSLFRLSHIEVHQ